MSYQDPNQPCGVPQQRQPGPVQSGGWGQQSQGSWGQPGGVSQQNPGRQQGSWGAPPQQGQIPQQPSYGAVPGYGQPGQSGPQDYVPQQFNPQPSQQQPGYGQGYPGGPQGYMPQSDFGSGANYGPGYPAPNQGTTSGLAIAALWLGILGGWGLINLVISILAIKGTGPGKRPGRGKAVTGLILTIAWAIVWAGLVLAVGHHATRELSTVSVPTIAATSGATGPAGAQATGASSDPGCQAAQTAFDTYSANAATGGLGAIQTLGDALVAASGQSRVAAGPLKTMGLDYLALANGTEPSNLVTDLESLDSACGISFTFSG